MSLSSHIRHTFNAKRSCMPCHKSGAFSSSPSASSQVSRRWYLRRLAILHCDILDHFYLINHQGAALMCKRSVWHLLSARFRGCTACSPNANNLIYLIVMQSGCCCCQTVTCLRPKTTAVFM